MTEKHVPPELDRVTEEDEMEEKPAEAVCSLCGEPMPAGEEMFTFHGYSGPCPKPPLSKPKRLDGYCPAHEEGWTAEAGCPTCQAERDAAIRERNDALSALRYLYDDPGDSAMNLAEEVLRKHGRLPKED